MADDHQNSGACQQSAHDRSEQGIDLVDVNEGWQKFDVGRERPDCEERLDGEGTSERTPAKRVKGQVNREQNPGEWPTCSVVNQEGGTRRAARGKPGLTQEQHCERHEQAAGEQPLRVFEQIVRLDFDFHEIPCTGRRFVAAGRRCVTMLL